MMLGLRGKLQDGMRRYLGVVGELMNWNGDYTECIIVVKENPLAGEFWQCHLAHSSSVSL